VERICKRFAQVGARDVSLLLASRDRGVGVNNTCVSNERKITMMLIPSFPTICPYVTTVGATDQFEPEVVAFRPDISLLMEGTVRFTLMVADLVILPIFLGHNIQRKWLSSR
jgi:subtilase family serine protease